jgi:hypothetical protein
MVALHNVILANVAIAKASPTITASEWNLIFSVCQLKITQLLKPGNEDDLRVAKLILNSLASFAHYLALYEKDETQLPFHRQLAHQVNEFLPQLTKQL